MKKSRLTLVAVGLAALLTSGCTPEKAEALKVAVTQFRSQATQALESIQTILKEGVEMPPWDLAKLTEDLRNAKFTVEMLKQIIGEDDLTQASSSAYDKAMDDAQQAYLELERIFESLDRGYLFAAGSVEKAQRHAVRLTTQMIGLAQMLNDGRIPVQFNARHLLLVEQIRRDNHIEDPDLRQKSLESSAQQLLALRDDERAARQKAIVQCLKAASKGRAAIDLIRNYKSMSLRDILSLANGALTGVDAIAGQPTETAALVKKFTAVQTAIESDPYWGPLLKLEVTKSEAPWITMRRCWNRWELP